ncbi:MAG: hypothetical protein K6F07_02985 [Bacilli bacterium]|nr:hypothetical protein [Bacilli bacterium]
MTNYQVYKKTLSFSLVRFLVDLLAVVILGGLTVGGVFLGQAIKSGAGALIGGIVGFILGIIAVEIITIFVGNRLKAAQIAMMVKGVDEGVLPESPYKEGKALVKERFASLTLFFFVTNSIKGAFRQLGRSLTRIGGAVGGDAGEAVTSVIDSAVQTLIAYLCDCCLGWVFYRFDQNVAKSACEGAGIFFKHGKTLFKNAGRIFGMGILSFLLIGGIFTGGFYALFYFGLQNQFVNLMNQIFNEGGAPDVRIAMIVTAAVAGVIIWSILHSVLIRPFVLVGVLRNFIASGKADVPSSAEFELMAQKSPRFNKLLEKANQQ